MPIPWSISSWTKESVKKLLTTFMQKQGKHMHLKPTSQFTYFPSLVKKIPRFSFCLTRCFLWKPEPFPGRSEDDVLWGKLGTGGSLEGGGPTTIWSPPSVHFKPFPRFLLFHFLSVEKFRHLSHSCFFSSRKKRKQSKHLKMFNLFWIQGPPG